MHKSTLFAALAVGALALLSHAQNAADAQPMIPGMVPGTLPGMVRPADSAMTHADEQRRDDADADDDGAKHDDDARRDGARDDARHDVAQDMLFGARDAEGNFAEITFATLALNKSRNPAVRSVANTIIQGHTQDLNDLMSIMRSKNMAMAPMLSASHMVVYDALKKAKGEKFDMMYMAGQVGDHENTIALYQTQIANGMDDALKNHASQFLPDVVGHTILIYNVARQVNAPGIALRPMMPPVPPGVTPAIMGKPIDMSSPQAVKDSINTIVMAMPMPR